MVNFSPRQIGKFMSEVLTLGFPNENGAVLRFAPCINRKLGPDKLTCRFGHYGDCLPKWTMILVILAVCELRF